MLMLINIYTFKAASLIDFNTSHVNVNQKGVSKGIILYRISIHLMLMLIQAEVFDYGRH